MAKVQDRRALIDPAPAAHSAPGLRALGRLLDLLVALSIEYCNWKSTPHLEAAMTGVRRLRFGQGVKTVHIDADEPLEHVLLQVKKQIWAEI